MIGVAGKHNRGAHDSPVGTALPPLKLLLALVAARAARAARCAAPPLPRRKRTPSDARSGPDPELRKILVAAIADADSFGDRFDAEVWLTDMSRRLARQVPDAEERLHILKTVHRQATLAGVEPELVLAVIDVESNFDRFAISSATALGLMQVMPFWVPELGYKDKNQLFDIEINVLLGCRILKYYLDMERGDLVRGLARYNGSVGKRWYSDRVHRAATDEVVSALSATSRRRSRAARSPVHSSRCTASTRAAGGPCQSQPASAATAAGVAGRDDFDAAVGEVLDPAVELQALGLLGRRGAVVDALHAAGDDAANRSRSRSRLSRRRRRGLRRAQREHGAVLRAHGIHARRAVGFLLDLPLGFREEAPRVGERVGRDAGRHRLARRR